MSKKSKKSVEAELARRDLESRIATEIMGEPQPDYPPESLHCPSRGGNWYGEWLNFTDYVWQALPFAKELDLAIRAVDTLGLESPELRLHYSPGRSSKWHAYWADGSFVPGNSAAEAICILLLILVNLPRER